VAEVLGIHTHEVWRPTGYTVRQYTRPSPCPLPLRGRGFVLIGVVLSLQVRERAAVRAEPLGRRGLYQ